MKSEMTTDDWENRHDDDFITISRSEYERLLDDSHYLNILLKDGDEDASESKQGDLFPEETK